MSATSLDDTSSFRRRRPLFWLVLVFCTGIVCDAWLAPSLPAIGGLFLAALLAAIWRLTSGGIPEAASKANPQSAIPNSQLSASFLCAAALALSAGMMVDALRARIPPGNDLSRLTSAAPSLVWLRGTILEVERKVKPAPSASDHASELPKEYQSWTLAVETLGADPKNYNAASGRLRLTLPAAAAEAGGTPALPGFGEGDRVELLAHVEAPPEVTLPGSFDHRAWLLGQGIRRTGVISSENLHRLSSQSWRRPDLLLRRASAALAEKAAKLLSAQEGESSAENMQAGLLSALLFGRRERLEASDQEAFGISGTAHLLAISGFHVQFLAGLLWRLMGALGISRRRAALLLILLACAFCALAGARAPVVRATLMIVLYFAAMLSWRQADPLNVLAASALGILCVAPAELFNAGFQLSFLAMLGLATIYPALNAAWSAWRQEPQPLVPKVHALFSKGRLLEYLKTLILASLAAWLATAPVVAWHMGRFSTIGLLANFLAVPLCVICMVCGAGMLCAALFSFSLAAWIAPLAGFSLWLLQMVNSACAALPFASIDLPPPAVPVMIVYAGILCWIWIERGRSATPVRLAGLLPACLVILTVGAFFRDGPAAASLTVLDLQHGRAALVEAPGGGAALVDTGGFRQGAIIAETLRRKGIHALALAVITEDDPDAIDGALDLFRRVPPARVLLPRNAFASATRRELERYLTAQAIPYASPARDELLQGPGGIRWEIFDDGPPPEAPARPAAALSVRVSLPGMRVLIASARSGQSLDRTMASGGEKLEAGVLRLIPGHSGRWPPEVAKLLRRCRCHTLIAGVGSDPAELSGADLAALSSEMQIKLVSPYQDGSLRVQADAGLVAGPTLEAFRGGVWHELK